MKKHLSKRALDQRREAAHYAAQAIIPALFPDKPIRRLGHEIRIGESGGMAYDLQKRVYHNHKTGKGVDIFALIMEATGCEFYDAIKQAETFAGGDYVPSAMPEVKPEQKANHNRLNALRIWQHAQRIGESDNPGAAYLRARGADILSSATFAEDLRSHAALYHSVTKRQHPAMVAAFRDVQDVVQAVHRTYLTSDGKKLSGDGINAR